MTAVGARPTLAPESTTPVGSAASTGPSEVPNAIAASTSTSAAKGNLVLKWPFVLQMIGILATGTALALAVL